MEKLTVWVNFDAEAVDISGLRNHFGNDERFTYIEKRIVPHEKAIAMAEQTDILINTFDALGPEEFARISKRTKFVIRYGTGYDNIDVAAATKYGIPFANCPGANAPPVAELALTHILNCNRHFTQSYQQVKEGKWPICPGNELDGKTIGLMGFGNVARHLARMMSGFHIKLLAYDTFVPVTVSNFAKEHQVQFVTTPEELFQRCDIVSLHIPANASTEKSINRNLFNKAKEGLVLINTCRGKVIDEDDLIDALHTGKIRAAGLDVLTSEPPPLSDRLLHMENVYVTSHIAASTYESEMRTQKMITETVEAFLKQELTANVVNRKEIQLKR
ncbi:MAG: NAD(P)-dependent oxidoreductase [Sphaerochaetaceae bacterium]|nr:NAD(P)-dependent oxidoreductase [Sphaerochaetaceae bacterium]